MSPNRTYKMRRQNSSLSVAILALLITFTGSLTGCRTVQVTKAKAPDSPNKTAKLDGIPFYVKKAGCKHEVVWFEPIYTLTLEEITTPEGGNAKPQTTARGSAVLSLSQYREDTNVQTFLKDLSKVGAQFEDVLKDWNAITKVPYTPTQFPENAKDRVLASNTNTTTTYVDYAETYYINAKNPLAGSAKVGAKLASDGTLTEASVEIESKTLETLLGPINAAITAGLPLAAKVEGKPAAKQLKLTTEVSGYKHIFSRIDASKSFPCSVIAADKLPSPADYSRESVAAGGEKADKKGKNKIQISGEVVLPDTAAKPADDKGTTPK